jgi:hypothetical protein
MKNTNVEVAEADATAMPFPDGSFSAVLSFTMLHHVPSVTLQDQLLAEAWRGKRTSSSKNLSIRRTRGASCPSCWSPAADPRRAGSSRRSGPPAPTPSARHPRHGPLSDSTIGFFSPGSTDPYESLADTYTVFTCPVDNPTCSSVVARDVVT